ncbi:MAG: hypothetical protein PHP06_05955 [Clostridia bacterium]|nr:hypothetical protein [Clostridia bacterium]
MSVKDIITIFFILFGAGFIIAAMITEGNTVGKFSKSFCYVFGGMVLAISAYIYY